MSDLTKSNHLPPALPNSSDSQPPVSTTRSSACGIYPLSNHTVSFSGH
ncbi:hypothetical protein OIU79_030349 [Salix purpurea]|uniref:Uncharacterized protein n=1 Tax=Salix purpurea TaxID=77065 RepID=A0A9Q0V940_SALPP|nr:hypothetical protein OIU79_030349 [Salix purpurea]